MEIVMRRVSDLIPYGKNAKKHDETQVANVANSIRRFGWQQPIVVDERDVVVIGHCRLLAAKKLGLTEVPVTVASGLTDDEIRELRIADNKTNESPWDLGLLAEDIEGLDFDGFELDLVTAPSVENLMGDDERYTKETRVPQYEPKGDISPVTSLIDHGKADALLAEIESADITDDQKEFLRLAAYRHCRIDFEAVADYYVHQDEHMQRLMERSALVIIDYDDAIANGYTTMHDTLEQMLEDDLDA